MTREFAFGDLLVVDPLPPGKSDCLHVCLILCPEKCVRSAAPLPWLKRTQAVVHLWLALYSLFSALGGIVFVFFWSSSGSWEESIFGTLFGDISCVHRVFSTAQEYLLFVPAESWQDTWQDFFVFLSSCVVKLVGSEVREIGPWYSEPDKNFAKTFCSKLKWNYVSRGKEKHSEAFVGGCTKHPQDTQLSI